MQRIVSGGTTHIMGGRSEQFISRLLKWETLDPARAREIIGTVPDDTKNKQLKRIIIASAISGDMTQFIRKVHQSLCILYIDRISKWVTTGDDLSVNKDIQLGVPNSRYTEQANKINFRITYDQKPGPNYTDEMHLLKNIRFDGWCPNTPGGPILLGFCQNEPTVRMLQLLEFPITQFGLLELPEIQWPKAPDELTGPSLNFEDAEFPTSIKIIMPVLEQWERYFIDLAKNLVKFQTELIAMK